MNLIHQHLAELEHLKRVSGTHREGVVSEAFKDLRGAGHDGGAKAAQGLCLIEIRQFMG